MNWKGHEKKHLWDKWRNNPGICPKGLKETHEKLKLVLWLRFKAGTS
jgi:hypothetical protein